MVRPVIGIPRSAYGRFDDSNEQGSPILPYLALMDGQFARGRGWNDDCYACLERQKGI